HLRHVRIDLGRGDDSPDRLPGREGLREADAEPAAELRRIADRAPHSFDRGLQDDRLLDAVGNRLCVDAHEQPPACLFSLASRMTRNPPVAVWSPEHGLAAAGVISSGRREVMPMQVRNAHGKVCYVEIPARDVARSAEFYKTVFGWKIRKRGDGATA